MKNDETRYYEPLKKYFYYFKLFIIVWSFSHARWLQITKFFEVDF